MSEASDATLLERLRVAGAAQPSEAGGREEVEGREKGRGEGEGEGKRGGKGEGEDLEDDEAKAGLSPSLCFDEGFKLASQGKLAGAAAQWLRSARLCAPSSTTRCQALFDVVKGVEGGLAAEAASGSSAGCAFRLACMVAPPGQLTSRVCGPAALLERVPAAAKSLAARAARMVERAAQEVSSLAQERRRRFAFAAVCAAWVLGVARGEGRSAMARASMQLCSSAGWCREGASDRLARGAKSLASALCSARALPRPASPPRVDGAASVSDRGVALQSAEALTAVAAKLAQGASETEEASARAAKAALSAAVAWRERAKMFGAWDPFDAIVEAGVVPLRLSRGNSPWFVAPSNVDLPDSAIRARSRP